MGVLTLLRPALHRVPVVLLPILLGLAAMEGLRGWAASTVNERVANAWRVSEAPRPHDAPEWLIAHGLGLVEADRVDEALRVWQALTARTDAPSILVAMAWYNMGNVYLRQAMREFEAGRPDTAVVRADRAKNAYRRALRLEPSYWDAKYNLETAMYLRPDLPPAGAGGDDAGEVPEDAQSELQSLPEGHP